VIPTVLLGNDDDAVRSISLALQNNLRRVYVDEVALDAITMADE
jgi:hypothetical protein